MLRREFQRVNILGGRMNVKINVGLGTRSHNMKEERKQIGRYLHGGGMRPASSGE